MKLFIEPLAKILKSLFSTQEEEIVIDQPPSNYYKYILAIREEHFNIFERDRDYGIRRKLSGSYYRIWNFIGDGFQLSEVTRKFPIKIPETHNPELIYISNDEDLFEVLVDNNKLIEWIMTRIDHD